MRYLPRAYPSQHAEGLVDPKVLAALLFFLAIFQSFIAEKKLVKILKFQLSKKSVLLLLLLLQDTEKFQHDQHFYLLEMCLWQ
jgi:hypothetical protein